MTTSTTIPTTTTTVSRDSGLEGYRICLLELGVAIGEIGLDGRGRPLMARAMAGLDLDDRLVRYAVDECALALATGALDLGADPELRVMVQATLGAFAVCIRDQGVPTFPDPVRSFDGIGAPFPLGEIPWSDVDLAGAVTVCRRSLAPSSP
jgi:hypothetical protein